MKYPAPVRQPPPSFYFYGFPLDQSPVPGDGSWKQYRRGLADHEGHG